MNRCQVICSLFYIISIIFYFSAPSLSDHKSNSMVINAVSFFFFLLNLKVFRCSSLIFVSSAIVANTSQIKLSNWLMSPCKAKTHIGYMMGHIVLCFFVHLPYISSLFFRCLIQDNMSARPPMLLVRWTRTSIWIFMVLSILDIDLFRAQIIHKCIFRNKA